MTVISLANAKNILEQSSYDNSDLFFPVHEESFAERTGLTDPLNRKIIVRSDTNTVVGVNGKSYNLVRNADAFKVADEAIKRATSLNTDGMKITDRVAYAGGLSVREYVFPEHRAEVNVGDVTEMKLTIINSYDGSSNFKMMVGGWRLACLNGMVLGKAVAGYKNRHTASLSLKDVGDRIDYGIKAFKESGELWKQYVDTACSDDEARAYIKAMKVSENLQNSLELYWLRESSTLGKNLWAMYNALTYYSTHHPISRGRGNEAATKLTREADVSKVVQRFKLAA